MGGITIRDGWVPALCRLLVIGLMFRAVPPLAGQDVQFASLRTPKFPPGQLVELATSESNPRQQYAVYVPSGYRADREWPLLVVMDPRGRAMIPLARIREAAERLGYIAISSYNSRSDENTDPNADAINAILADAQRQFSIDIRRIYLVGQSGTARASWIFGYGLRGHVAGIIGIGASKPENFLLTPRPAGQQPTLVFFGAAGTTDYNYEEVSALDTALARVNLPHHITWYDGPHAWPPAATLAEGVEYMELMAMRFGLKPADGPWIDSSYAARLAAAKRLADSGDNYHAWLGYKAIAGDFEGLEDVSQPAASATRLARSDEVRRTGKEIEQSLRIQRDYNQRLAEFLGDFRKKDSIPLGQALDRVQLRALEQRMAGADSLDANAAARGIEQLWVYASFYEPMDYLDRGDPIRALGILELAQAMRPGDPDVCWQQARALARLKREQPAISALECAARGPVSPERIERDPDLQTLAAAPAYRALLSRLRTSPTGQVARYGW
jgi:predicted esterase